VHQAAERRLAHQRDLAQAFAGSGFSCVYTSPLNRALETAEIVAAMLHHKPKNGESLWLEATPRPIRPPPAERQRVRIARCSSLFMAALWRSTIQPII
jgi:broad specificity phosphatase PhoE